MLARERRANAAHVDRTDPEARFDHRPAVKVGAGAIGAQAVGAQAIGTLALAAIAVGAWPSALSLLVAWRSAGHASVGSRSTSLLFGAFAFSTIAVAAESRVRELTSVFR